METISSSAQELRINYSALARNVRSMALVPLRNRKNILERIDRELPPDIRRKALGLLRDIFHDRKFCEEAGVDYADIPMEIVRAALAEYLLRVKPFD